MFDALPAATQQRLRNQDLALGDTADMVYVALGTASTVDGVDTARGRAEVWTYKNMSSTNPTVSMGNNNPGAKFQGTRESVNAPRNDKSLSTTSGGPRQQMDVSDSSVTLYVGLVNGAVVRFSLEPINLATL